MTNWLKAIAWSILLLALFFSIIIVLGSGLAAIGSLVGNKWIIITPFSVAIVLLLAYAIRNNV